MGDAISDKVVRKGGGVQDKRGTGAQQGRTLRGYHRAVLQFYGSTGNTKQHAFGFMFRPCIKNYHFPEGKEYVNMKITQCISHLSS